MKEEEAGMTQAEEAQSKSQGCLIRDLSVTEYETCDGLVWTAQDEVWGDRHYFSLFADGSFLFEDIEFYPEYWQADAFGQFDDDPRTPWDARGGGDLDRLSDPVCGALINSLCYSKTFNSLNEAIDSLASKHSLDIACHYDSEFRWTAFVAESQWKYAPFSYVHRCKRTSARPRVGNRIFWMTLKHSWSESFSADVFYPKDETPGEKVSVRVRITRNGARSWKTILWEHGKHGLTKKILKCLDIGTC